MFQLLLNLLVPSAVLPSGRSPQGQEVVRYVQRLETLLLLMTADQQVSNWFYARVQTCSITLRPHEGDVLAEYKDVFNHSSVN